MKWMITISSLFSVRLFSCLPVCPHPWRFFRLSICLLDGPLCHSATNGHCWASHFLNDTLLRSIQLPCSYTLTPLLLFTFRPPSSLLCFLSCTTEWLPSLVWKKSSFLSIFSQYFPLNMPLEERPSPCLMRTHSHTFMYHISAAEWLTDGVQLEHLLPADSSSRTYRMIRTFIIHSSHHITSLSLL